MPRCESCNKFVGLETQDPEVSDLEIDADGHVTCRARVVRTSECCGEEMKEATLELEAEAEISDAHGGDGHDLEVEEDEVETIEEGGGRYKKSYYGARVTATVRCSCRPTDPIATVEMQGKVAASEMDELT